MNIEKVIDDVDTVLKKNGLGIDEYRLGDEGNMLFLTIIPLILRKPQRKRCRTYKSEEELILSREHTKECVRMLQLGNGDITAAKYDCGHSINPVIIDTDEFTLTTYIEWKHDDSGLCLECWLKRRKEK